ncbi:FtsH protease activity modulator HflK [uncultured Desulfovibrio sp.]|uniref:FtsH protease activity modulator HflK n=1 Tax=uncultured Desulfovibrio sp. TaxID=167968 RepID=UPI00262DEAD5|nr:FtsH protease activity modulator HflK [uncultured Desulfovibrio sp.]
MNWDWDKLQEKRERQQKRPTLPDPRQDDRDEYDDDRDERRNRRSPFGGDPRGGLPKLPKWQFPNGLLIGGGLLAVLVIWLLSGIYIVNPGEEGVVLRFGKYDRTVGPGPHYALPAPIEKVYKPQVSRVLRSEVGYRSAGESRTYQKGQVRPIPAEASMLTGDENIINVQFSVQYRIADPVAYLFNIHEPDMLVRSAAEAAMREVIGNSYVDAALTDGKLQIQADTTRLLQNILDRYDTGLQVIAVQLQDVHPPDEVRDAFKDVASAREDKIRIINEAEAYRNELIPRARGEAAAIGNKAEAYRATRIQNAEGEAARFNALSAEHARAPKVMEHRLYYETLEDLLRNAREKVLLDGKSPERILPYLPLSGVTTTPAAGTTEKR